MVFFQKNKVLKLVIIILLLVFVYFGLDDSIQVVTYKIDSNKIDGKVRIALLTDFHSNDSKDEVIDMLSRENVDIVLLGGDIIDDELEFNQGYDFVEELVKEYSCYYVSGNHEYWSGEYEQIRKKLINMNVIVLEGDCEKIKINNQSLNVCGIDDFENEEALNQLLNCEEQLDNDYNILLSHRPEKIDIYNGYDLVLSGHAHGGQWRIPYLINGLVSPNQGLFPKYAGGLYELEDKDFIVSRGLAKESTRVFRFYNHREIVVVEIQ
jgi:predicted MPP superfamily phosphohydrolase